MDNIKKSTKDSTPDSLRQGGGRRTASASSNTYETTSIGSTSIMEKLWNDEIEETLSNNNLNVETLIANMFVEYKRSSILTNIAKITLKSMGDLVQKHRFSQNGLQQLQVNYF